MFWLICGSPRIQKYALLVVGIYCALTNARDIGGLPASDKRVIVYQALERQYLGSADKQTAPQTNCDNDSELYTVTTSVLADSGEYQQVTIEAGCEFEITTGCQSGMFPISNIEVDGRWAWTKSRIGYLNYLHELVLKSQVPETALKIEFDSMEKLIIQNIDRRLSRPVKLQMYDYNSGMGVSNDVDHNLSRAMGLEREFAARWNSYVLSLPNPQRKKIALLIGEAEGCGAGETEYEVTTNPKGGKLRFISDIDAKLCESLNLDPWDFNKCDGWSAIGSKKIGLVGTYRYFVEWPNGKNERARVNVDQQRDAKLCLPLSCP